GATRGSVTTDAAFLRIDGDAANTYMGSSVAGPGDVDGDGADDLWVGASGAAGNGATSGAAFLYYGPLSGSLLGSDASAEFDGPSPDDHLGYVGLPGDVDGDGHPDLLAGAPFADGDEAGSGVAWLIPGAAR